MVPVILVSALFVWVKAYKRFLKEQHAYWTHNEPAKCDKDHFLRAFTTPFSQKSIHLSYMTVEYTFP